MQTTFDPPDEEGEASGKVPPIIVQKIFTQIFSYINVQLINSLLLRRECCTFSNGEYVKAGIAELELWCCQAKEEVLTWSTILRFGIPQHRILLEMMGSDGRMYSLEQALFLLLITRLPVPAHFVFA
ncbi:hypothetical protein RJ640_004022 [Escallonia rubra]|uniref:Dilute domain-containing protein n=1 Tax=Escallonia rubra TaxID=112253 RepID=A0AA88QL17_9ASTE|nr:hypothetical protein RJ640_004022 [Escallonia rubra]